MIHKAASMVLSGLRGLCCVLPAGVVLTGSACQTTRPHIDAELGGFFEGKEVIAKIEMPATRAGVNVYPARPAQFDWDDYNLWMDRVGPAIEVGDTVRIAVVRARGQHIEVQIGDGGYGGGPRVRTELERELNSRMFELRSLLAFATDSARVEGEKELAALQMRLDSVKAAEDVKFREAIRQMGSRFNIRYDAELTDEAMRPEMIMAALQEYLTFPRDAFGIAAPFSPSYSEDVSATVVKITSNTSLGREFGTGFVFMVRPARVFIVTANHVVSDEDGFPAADVSVAFDGVPVTFAATVHSTFPTYDVAVLSLEEFPAKARMIRLGSSEDVPPGTQVYAYGYPGGGNLNRDDGSVRAREVGRILLDAIEPSRGYSGGPLMQGGENAVVAMILQRAAGQGQQYALEVDLIVLLLRTQADFAELFGR